MVHLSSARARCSGDAINNQRRVPGKTIRDGTEAEGSGEEAVMLSVGQSGINCIGIESRSAGAGLLWSLVGGGSDGSAPEASHFLTYLRGQNAAKMICDIRCHSWRSGSVIGSVC